MNSNIIQPEIIKDLAPKDLVYNVIAGIQKNHKLYLGVMFDVEEKDPQLGQDTGRLYIANIDERAPYCKLLRNSNIVGVPDICKKFTTKCFNDVKEKCANNPNYKGSVFNCSPGDLVCFSVPIVERENNTFIGVVFGGQKRLKETNLKEITLFNRILERNENNVLRNIPRNSLYKAFVQVDKVSNEELVELKKIAEKIADDLAKRFEYYVRDKIREDEIKLQQDIIRNVYALIIEAQDMKKFQECLLAIPEVLHKWMKFDWCIVVESIPKQSVSYSYRIIKTIGRGLGPSGKLINREWAFPLADKQNLMLTQMNPDFLKNYFITEIPPGNEYWWVPLVSSNSVYSAYILGSAKGHMGSTWNEENIREKIPTIEDIASRLTLKHDILLALEKESIQRKEAETRKVEAVRASESMQDTVLALTHQLKRPLIMVQQALSNVRDLINIVPYKTLSEDVEIGRLAARHSEILCRGISKILAVEGGGRFDHSVVKIDVKKELTDLCQAMERLSERESLSFRFFDQSPTIMMDRDSFLYVFYALIDNAIKYSDTNTVIDLVCDEERSTSKYAIKVKSFGLPIDPEQKDKIFQKFWRGSRARHFDDTGIGLGCWAAKRHMELNGGKLDVEVQGKLTVFIVYPPEVK